MKYADIKYYDIANGLGVRTSLFVSGCTHRCRGCFNENTWDFNYGNDFTEETIQEILESISPKYISGLTLLGGEPMEPSNQRALLPLLEQFKKRFPEKTSGAIPDIPMRRIFYLLMGGPTAKQRKPFCPMWMYW